MNLAFHISEDGSEIKQRIFRCSLQCRINMNLVFHISEDGSEIELENRIAK